MAHQFEWVTSRTVHVHDEAMFPNRLRKITAMKQLSGNRKYLTFQDGGTYTLKQNEQLYVRREI